MLEPIPFAGMVEIDESFDRTASHMANQYVSYNEPVAWMTAQGIQNVCTVNEKEEMGNDFDDYTIPLYTHPVKLLMDYEIKEIYLKSGNIIDFANAILTKASEK